MLDSVADWSSALDWTLCNKDRLSTEVRLREAKEPPLRLLLPLLLFLPLIFAILLLQLLMLLVLPHPPPPLLARPPAGAGAGSRDADAVRRPLSCRGRTGERRRGCDGGVLWVPS